MLVFQPPIVVYLGVLAPAPIIFFDAALWPDEVRRILARIATAKGSAPTRWYFASSDELSDGVDLRSSLVPCIRLSYLRRIRSRRRLTVGQRTSREHTWLQRSTHMPLIRMIGVK